MDATLPRYEEGAYGFATFGPATFGREFTWATGIEDTFIPHVRHGLRALDEYELTQHYAQWKSDFDLVAETGVHALRWGIPWYKVQPKPDVWDWSWTDACLDYLVNVKGITPILDVMHYGTPLWMENSFINCCYADAVAEYAAKVAERYGSLIQWYTPLNEPLVNASMCGYEGLWPPYLSGDDGYFKMIMALTRGMIATVKAIAAVAPHWRTVQVEALWRNETRVESLQERVRLSNELQYIALDLTTGRVGEDHALTPRLRKNGVRESDLLWYRENAVDYDVLGANFYPWSAKEMAPAADGRMRAKSINTHGGHVAAAVADFYNRYGKPVMITETSSLGGLAARERWMDGTINGMFSLREQGVPVVGYTWFPMFTMIDWAYRKGRRPLASYLIHLGIYDATFDADGVLRRERTPLVDRFQAHMARSVPPIASPLRVEQVTAGQTV
ncbi:MAG: family 1 glycosylhydrolase [Anaerolineae bacterium]|jgi:beta-glucosidase/6-phospho-beta-glucosidase/beta-galactosidase|nr:family 1 glycosylhydrolase [Anaerolineae bacterium]